MVSAFVPALSPIGVERPRSVIMYAQNGYDDLLRMIMSAENVEIGPFSTSEPHTIMP